MKEIRAMFTGEMSETSFLPANISASTGTTPMPGQGF